MPLSVHPTDLDAPHITEDRQSTIWNYNYPTTKGGNGKWSYKLTTSHIPLSSWTVSIIAYLYALPSNTTMETIIHLVTMPRGSYHAM
jgi:hypothetical protein